MQKIGRKDDRVKATIRIVSSYLFILIVLVAMILYQNFSENLSQKVDENGKVIREQTQEMKIKGYIYTFVYSIIVIIFGNLYKILAAQ